MKFVRFILGATICLFALYGGYELYVQRFANHDDSGDIVQELRDAGFEISSGHATNEISAMMQSDLGTPTASFGMGASSPPPSPGLPSSGRTSGGLPPSLRNSAAPATVVVPEQPVQQLPSALSPFTSPPRSPFQPSTPTPDPVSTSLRSPDAFQQALDVPLFLNSGSAATLTPPPTIDLTGEATSTGQAIEATPSSNLESNWTNTTPLPVQPPPSPSIQEKTPEQVSVQRPSNYTFGVAMPSAVPPVVQQPVNPGVQETAIHQPMVATPQPQVQPLPRVENAPINPRINQPVVIPGMLVRPLPPVEDEVPATETPWAMTPALPDPPQIALPDPPQFVTPPVGQPPQYVQNDPGFVLPQVTIPTSISPSDQQFVRQDNPPQIPQIPLAPTPSAALIPPVASSEVQPTNLTQNPGQQQQVTQANNVTPLPQSQDSAIAPEVAANVAKIGELLIQGQVSEAYEQLSRMYFYGEMTPEERQYVAKHLDLLAGGILFSRTRHILEPSYAVKEGDTIASIATQYKITPELLRKLNGIPSGTNAVAGMELKVLRGPLDARIYPDYHEMVVMMRDKYACRFPISVGSSYAGQEGSFTVQEKALNRSYQLAPGMEVIPPGDPNNPLGSQWIELSKEQGTIGIHGTNRPEQIGTTRRSAGFFGLRDKDIAEVYDMLTVGSNVTIVR